MKGTKSARSVIMIHAHGRDARHGKGATQKIGAIPVPKGNQPYEKCEARNQLFCKSNRSGSPRGNPKILMLTEMHLKAGVRNGSEERGGPSLGSRKGLIRGYQSSQGKSQAKRQLPNKQNQSELERVPIASLPSKGKKGKVIKPKQRN